MRSHDDRVHRDRDPALFAQRERLLHGVKLVVVEDEEEVRVREAKHAERGEF
jgi:hypothetical protein